MHMSYDFISVIVPVYNMEKYIHDCIYSLQHQSCENDYEIVVVDDGSSDSSGLLCDQFAETDSRIKVFHKSNGGLSDARNYGIKHASGNLLCFVDSDDFVHKDYLKTLYEIKKATGANIAECAHVLYYEGVSTEVPSNHKEDIVLQPMEWITESGLGDFYSVVAWNKLYDRNLFDNTEFPVGRNFEDEATTYKLVYSSKLIARTYKRLYYYRQREGSITKDKKTLKTFQQQLLSLSEKCDFFANKKEYNIIPFCQAKYCIFVISNYKLVNKLYGENSKKSLFYSDVLNRYHKWIKNNRHAPLKYRLFILRFLMLHFMDYKRTDLCSKVKR